MTTGVIQLLVFVMASVLSALLTWWCRRLAFCWGFVDRPLSEAHKAHRQAMPVLGGLAMCVAWNAVIWGGLAAYLLLASFLPSSLGVYLPGAKASVVKLAVIAAGGVMLTAMGMADDRHAMKAGRKFFLQFAVAAAVGCCVPVSVFYSFGFLPHGVAGLLNWAVTVFWMMGVINALNFFDNMDGLAGGTAMFGAFFLALIAVMRGQVFVGVLAAATCGVAAGFLFFNRPPARIFMGDGGSHFLGYSLALLGVMTTFYQAGESPTLAPVLIPPLVLSLPLFDAVAVILIRLKEHRPIYVGDTRHLSHRFVHLGLTRPQAVYVIWLLCIVQGTGAVTLVWLPLLGAALVLFQEIAVFLVISIIQFFISETSHDNRKP